MFETPIQANGTKIIYFTTAQEEEEYKGIRDRVNEWLSSQKDNIVIHDISFTHLVSSDAHTGIFSIFIIYGEKEIPVPPF